MTGESSDRIKVYRNYAVSALQEDETLTADKKYPLFLEAHKTAATKTLPKKERNHRKKASWKDDAVMQARNQLKDAHKQQSVNPTASRTKQYLRTLKRILTVNTTRWKKTTYKKKSPPYNQPLKVYRVGWHGPQ